jgi:hypothetical protein
VLTPTGRTVRAAAIAALLLGLVVGTIWGDDDHFPFGPFRMYSTTSQLDGVVRAVKLEGVDETGAVFPVRFADVGLRRSEVEGQLPLFIDDPARLGHLVEAYEEFGPEERYLMELRLLLGIHDLRDGRPVDYREQLLETWRRS